MNNTRTTALASRHNPARPARRGIPLLLTIAAAALLLASLKLPLWKMHLEAPQYRDEEALNIAVHPNSFHGDLKELTVLDQYIGVHIPRTLPQFSWLPGALIAAAGLGIAAGCLRGRGRRLALAGIAGALTVALVVAAVQANTQMRDIGHKRDHKTVLVGVPDFTPPFLGTSKIAQFTVSSRFGAGAWLIGVALALQLTAAGLSRSPAPARDVVPERDRRNPSDRVPAMASR